MAANDIEKPATSANGIPVLAIARTGHTVCGQCLDSSIAWDLDDARPLWEQVAARAVTLLDGMIAGEESIQAKTLAAKIASWFGAVNFDEMPIPTQLAFEAVGRHWVSLLTEESNKVDVGKAEQFAIGWFKKQVANRNGTHVELPTKPIEIPPELNNRQFVVNKPEETVKLLGPTFIHANPLTNGSSVGFRKIIADKIRDHEAKAASLHRLLDQIGPDSDEALWEIFGPLFSKEKK